ncbi:hypothetical protein [Sphingobium yanoikuyae]|uniref:hypothetical protein n=1 Tax=Sphingobium yanoikuyae TaxID=13690 RepID=UPI0026F17B55|nr:hypothetical protein [Sphingobium yanoikuyae]
MEVRVLFWAPLPVKNGHHAHDGRFSSPDCSFEQSGGAGNPDLLLIDSHFGNEEGDIRLAQCGVFSAQALTHQFAKRIHHLWRYALRGLADLPFERIDRRGRRCDASIRLGQQAGERCLLERGMSVRQRFIQVAEAGFGLGLMETRLREIAGAALVGFG